LLACSIDVRTTHRTDAIISEQGVERRVNHYERTTIQRTKLHP
jgi:hypothetical protein